jgi:lipopolysaccharide transport system ATP-binding protein
VEIIRVENLSKLYRLGKIGTGTLSKDLNRWWAQIRGKEDPYIRMGQVNDRTKKSSGSDLVWAIKDISFSVNQGEVVGVIGRNGAGKSTLLKIISQITTPSQGTIKLRGRIASLLEVGTGFHPEMTGRENIFMNGTLLGMSRREIQNKLDDIVDFAGVALYVDTPVKRYSSGMQVRLAFAVAAFLEPEILIVDEVLAVGDADFQKRALGRMQEVSKGDGRTVLFVSHNMQSIQKLCNKSLLLNSGQLSEIGETNQIIKSYLEGNTDGISEVSFDQFWSEDKLAFATKLTIEDLNGKLLNEIPIGKVWRVKIHFTVVKKTQNLVVGLGMIDKYETPVRTSWNTPTDFEAGKYIAVFTEEKIKFSAGRYRLLVGISKGLQTIQYIDNNLWFTISDVIENQDASVVRNDNGILLNQMTMYVEKDSQ